MAQSTLRGRFVWYELMTTDPSLARKFYTDVVGWGTSEWNGMGTPYTMWTANDTPMGGVMQLPPEAAAAGAPPHWVTYVGTPNVDQTAKQVTERGGSVVVEPTDIPTVGRFAVCADPQGATFAIFTPEQQPPGDDGEPRMGQFSWHELLTTDSKAAFDFYSALFGWQKTEAMDMGDKGVYQMYGLNGKTFGGMFDKTADMPMPPNWLIYATVPDINSAVERVKRGGGKIMNGPMEVPGGDWIVQCMDPQGAAFALHAAATKA